MVIFIRRVGIVIRGFEENKKEFIGIREDLFRMFYKYDVSLIGIPISNDFDKIKDIVNLCDGIVLSGGDNFIDNDFLLIDYLYKNNIPTLGICLGMQGMGRYFSNKSEVNIDNHMSSSKYVHYVNIKKDSLLYKIINKDKILVNSRHKSALIDTKLEVNAISDDGVIEGVEDASKKFFVGVEWHPESLDDINTNKLFDYFIQVVTNKKT